MLLLTVNSGSSSLKLSLVRDANVREAESDVDTLKTDDAGLEKFLATCPQVAGVVHRFVHGGRRLRDATLITSEVRDELESAIDFAPLHLPRALHFLDEVQQRLKCPQIACFDTGFFAALPVAAATYAVPLKWREEYGLRRYGFHGLSYAGAVRRAPELLDAKTSDLNIVVAHVGSGVSVTAIRHGLPVATSMGFSPLEGAVMATRSGSIDPAAVLWLQEAHRLTTKEIGAELESKSGLLGLAGTSDMRELLQRADSGDTTAQLARDIFVGSLAQSIAAMASALPSLDALIFTGGIGSNSHEVRELVCARLGVLGIEKDLQRVAGDGIVSRPSARIRVAALRAQEDLEMARETELLLAV